MTVISLNIFLPTILFAFITNHINQRNFSLGLLFDLPGIALFYVCTFQFVFSAMCNSFCFCLDMLFMSNNDDTSNRQ